MFNKKKILVSEVNRYTKPVIKLLTDKYNKVTHPNFDIELREITGIGWKQIRNYRNNPNPSQVISDNSKVKAFILEKRKSDKFYKAKLILINVVAIVLIGLTIIILYKGLSNTANQEEDFDVLVEKSLENLLGNKSLKGCIRIDSKTIKCPDGLYKSENINE